MGKTGIIPIKAGAQGEEGRQERSGHDSCCFERDVTETDPKIRVSAGAIGTFLGLAGGPCRGGAAGAPETIRTSDPCLRRAVSLRDVTGSQSIQTVVDRYLVR